MSGLLRCEICEGDIAVNETFLESTSVPKTFAHDHCVDEYNESMMMEEMQREEQEAERFLDI